MTSSELRATSRARRRATIAWGAVLGVLSSAAPAACAGGAARGRVDAPPRVAITHVDVIDVADSVVRRDRNVIIAGNRIVAEGPAASVAVPAGARTIEGQGRYLIPGLWDMHVHTTMPGGGEVLPLYIAAGVTGVRDMAGEWRQLTTWRREIRQGLRVGPRMILSGPYLEGADIPIPHLLVRHPDDAQPAVDSLISLGVDFVKVHGQLTRESYLAIARAARARGITLAGHVPRAVGAAEASDSGVRSIEHLLTIPNACTPAESVALVPRYAVQGALGRCTSDDLGPLFARLARNGTWVVPTLVAQVEVALWPTRALPGDSLARYLPDSLRRYVTEIFPMPGDVPSGADTVGRQLFEKRVAITGALHRAGVGIMTGTDAPLRNSPPGFGLHEELIHFVRAGISPLDALRAATIGPARFLGMLDSLGTVDAGKVADLVLLEANPLDDIRHTRRIAAVVTNGRPFLVRHDAEGHHLIPIP